MRIAAFLPALAAVGIALSAATAASAHAHLERAAPAENAVLSRAPEVIVLQFTEGLEPAFSDVAVTDAAGKSVPVGKPAVDDKIMKLKLPALAPGRYRVRWNAVSTDTHRSEGGYSFTVSP